MSTKLDTTSQGPSTGPNQKFSRYRSVRRAAAETQPTWTGQSSPDKPANETIARSMSRYHRPRTTPTTNPLMPPMSSAGCPPVPSLPVASIQAIPTSQSRGLPAVSSPPRPATTRSAKSHEGNMNVNVDGNVSAKTNEKEKDEDDEDTLSPAEKARMREAAMRKLTMAEQPQARQTNHGVLSTGQIKNPREKEKEKEKEREREKEGAMGHSKRASWKERFAPSHRRKESPSRTEHIPTESTKSSIDNSSNNNTTALTVPGIDAPVSAVNAGERRVLIKCKSSSIRLPITPATRVKDVIFSAANCFSERIDPKTAILVESFSSLGLERPLRRYEHVRDVLNSWASDDENCLVLSDAPSESASRQLELHSAPNTAPKDAKFYVYHSSRPNKWDKRYVTLRTDGQVVLSKKSDANEAKDFTNVCHLSDFDIYTPTARQLAKQIKPPKKLCFSIKSQQKSTMFLSTENFVRFFATNDSTIAQDFYNAIQSWRSWYLVHVLEVGKKQQDTASGNVSKPMSRDGHISPVHKRHISTESNPYQLGSFKPLIEFGQNLDASAAIIDKSVEENNETSWDIFMRRKKARDHTGAPSSFPVNLPALDTQTDSLSLRDDQSTFSPDSLLGRTYSERQAAQRERQAREGNETDPFLSHGLLKNLSPISPDQVSQHTQFTYLSSQQTSRSNTVRSHHRGPDGMPHSRSNSVRQKGKPLVDLTPTYREPPQHAKKGHGVKVDVGVPLVEVATGLEAVPGVPNIPPATTWRREEAASGAVAGRHRVNTVKSQRHPHPHAQLVETHLGSPDGTPFIPNGLVALSANNAPIQLGTGRGIATGDRHATRPLLDLKPQIKFAEGSLLRSIEKM